MTGKTKAAMPGRQCNTALQKHRQITRLAAGGQTLSRRNSEPADFIQLLRQSPKVSFAYNSLTPLFFLTLGKKGGKSNPTLCFLFLQTDYRVSHIRALTIQYVEYAVATKKTIAIASRHLPRSVSGINHSSGSALAFLRWSSLSFLRNDSSGNCIDLAFGSASTGCEFFCSFVMCQPLGSMPRCCSSLRMMRLSQADRVSSPSSFIACNMASSNAGSTRKAICLFPLGILMFDMCLTLSLILVVSCNVYHVSDTCKVRSPVSAGNTSGPLTKPLSEVTAMADQQLNPSAATNTNTFLWRFLALSSIGCNVVHIPANTEREAREKSPDGCVMVFAGRLPVREVRHA